LKQLQSKKKYWTTCPECKGQSKKRQRLHKKAIIDAIKGISNSNFEGGHSVIFKSYIKDNSGNITGLNYYDYSGVGRNYTFSNNSIMFIGANLKDL